MLSRTDEIVAEIIEKWSAGFCRLDAEALASLYSKSVFFFGSKSLLYRGHRALRTISMRCRDGTLRRFGLTW